MKSGSGVGEAGAESGYTDERRRLTRLMMAS